uniref:Uncharacterized protein n=1 Tax=Romanomermis culicivorax TaxID=13658 RepID=A0A915JTF4_ROMCU
MSILTDKLTFWQRVQTLLSYLIGYLGDWVYYYVMQRNLVDRFYPDLSGVSLRSSQNRIFHIIQKRKIMQCP